MIDIIIPHYNEPWHICKKLFLSLEMQRIVNWNEIKVTVINDGGNSLPEEELLKLSYPVIQLSIPKSGVSKARNVGIDCGTEPWIMFCDCDDSFTNIYALDEILSTLRRSKADVLWAKCLTEFGRMVVPIADDKQFIFIHAKVYRRQFLIDENLRFNEELVYSEDTLFNDQIREKTDNIQEIRCSYQPYVWIRRGGSVTTKEGQ
jgi:glycosyltransferase involved in cell wall biosynthesis